MQKHKKSSRRRKKGLDAFSKKKSATPTRREKHEKPRGPLDSVLTEENEVFSTQDSDTLPDALLSLAREKPKRGRRTTSDDFLIEARNVWLHFFEGSWHEIGWSLLQIREQGSATIDEIRSVFEPVGAKGNGQLANCFLRGSPQPSEGKERRSNNKRLSTLHLEIRRMNAERQDLETNRRYAETALKDVDAQYREAIEADVEEKKRRLLELTQRLPSVEDECKRLEQTIRNQESYLYCSQLLAFLCKGRYAVKPFPLANSLAGLPQMGWRRSLARCSEMPTQPYYVQYPYGIWVAILKIWKHRSTNPQLSVIDLFRVKIPKLTKKNGEARTYLSEGWRDLRMAIEQCSKETQNDSFMPYAITKAFVNNRARTKNQAEQILEQREKLTT